MVKYIDNVTDNVTDLPRVGWGGGGGGLGINLVNEKMSFKMGVKFAAPFYMGISSDILYEIRGQDKPN